jgi:hypothetical protein
VYLPADAITQDRQAGQLTTLEQLTENKQFAGDGSLQAAARSPIGVPSPAHIEEIKDASAGALAVRPTAAQMAAAVRVVKGLPVFDRL